MSDIAPLGSPAPASYQPNGRIDRQAAAYTAPTRGSDRFELSDTGRLLSRMSEIPEVRQNLVDRVKAEIAAGTYETSDKFDEAIDNLVQDLR